MSRVRRIIEKGLVSKHSVPRHFPDSIQYETMMGSVAYGVSGDLSDVDIYGFCIPEKHVVFPHLAGYIPGFGQQPEKFDQWQVHHVKDEEKGTEYDFNIYNIVKYFSLVMENNPNMVDSLFTPPNAILHCSPIAQMVRDERHVFLHKGAWHKFKGYAYSQMHKIRLKDSDVAKLALEAREYEEKMGLSHGLTADDVQEIITNAQLFGDRALSEEQSQKYLALLRRGENAGKRFYIIKQFGYDVKFAYHVVRLIDEVEQILVEETLDLQRNREKLKAIRRGEWTLEQIEDYFIRREKDLEKAYSESKLPHSPDEKRIRQLLLNCLEHYYGNLSDAVVDVDAATRTLQQVAALIRKAGF
jgi:predicted nucleotidyltransferase